MRLKLLLCAILATVTLLIYWPVGHFDLIYWDDYQFVTDPFITGGLSWSIFIRALTQVVASDWHPLTNLSFVLVHQAAGINPGAEHLVNVFFHAANSVLLFLLLARMTSAEWKSAMATAIFAWHPLRVESVAWIAERKDVLFAFFMLLSLMFYTSYDAAQRNRPAKIKPGIGMLKDSRYWLALLFFCLGLLSKSTIVTLPLLLLLLDIWPLKRFDHLPVKTLLLEKIPFFLLSILSGAFIFYIHKTEGDVMAVGGVSITMRFQNVALSYVNYLGKLFWPTPLALIYPFPINFDKVQVLLDVLFLLAVSAFCILQIRRRPYLAVGWFWYLISMLPVIGFIQVGAQAMADRHTYISLIGPVVGLVWLVSEWAKTEAIRKVFGATALAVIIACILLTHRQIQFWRNGVTLFSHTIEVTPANVAAELPLAVNLDRQGCFREAAAHYQIATELPPDNQHYEVQFYYSSLLEKMGRYKEAKDHMETTIKLRPDWPRAMNNLAWLLATCPDAGLRDGQRAVQLAASACFSTRYQEVKYVSTLAAAYAEAGQWDEAVAIAQQAIAVAQEQHQSQLVEKNKQLLHLYLAHQAYHPSLQQQPDEAAKNFL